MRIDLSQAAGSIAAPSVREQSPIGLWLLILALMVLAMVVLGGLTRLTGSGLSMVEWQPFTFLPPLSDAAWQAMFAKYQQSPQYQLVNSGMTVGEFKGIFWLEYVHRLWGRLIGVVFLGPFILFALRGRFRRAEIPRLLLLFLLGGLQGALGWFMVKSGLAQRPEVSHYRLAAHLVAALIIYGALLWSALDYFSPTNPRPSRERVAAERPGEGGARPRAIKTHFFSALIARTPPHPALRAPLSHEGRGAEKRLRGALIGLLALVCLTIPAGALVAGLHAGLVYNTFPLMNGDLLPPEAFDLSPGWLNAFENHALVQFDHRLLAITTWVSALALWLWSRRLALAPRLRSAIALIPVAASLQAGLGISTLLLAVPVGLAAAHQAGAFLLFSVVLWALHEAVVTAPSSPARR